MHAFATHCAAPDCFQAAVASRAAAAEQEMLPALSPAVCPFALYPALHVYVHGRCVVTPVHPRVLLSWLLCGMARVVHGMASHSDAARDALSNFPDGRQVVVPLVEEALAR